MSETQPPKSAFKRLIIFICLSIGTFMMVLDYSIANVSIPYISGDLSVSTDQGTYVITSFSVGSAIGLAMTGWLTKRVGDVKLMTISVLLFTLLSWVCGLSFNLPMLVVSRFFQGLFSGPVIPLSQSLVITQGTPKTRSRDLATWSMIVITAPVLGPILGGYISDWYHWSWIFYINIPVGILCATVIWMMLKHEKSETEKIPGDIWGMVLLSIGVACLQIFLDKGQQWDWFNSDLIWMLIAGMVIAFTFLLIREFTHEHPFLELRLFAIPSFSISIICLAVSYAVYFGTIVLVPLWLQEYMGYNAENAGFAVCTLGIAPILLSAFTPLIIKKLGNTKTLILAFVFFGFGCFYTSFFTTAVDLGHIAFSRFVFGFGFVCYIAPMLGMNVQEISAAQLPSATGIFHFVRAVVGGIGTSLFTTLWVRRTIFHHERVGCNVTPFNPVTPQARDLPSLQMLNDSMDQQASLLALNDAFYLMGWIFVGLITLLFVWNIVNVRFAKPLQVNNSSMQNIEH